MSDPAGKAVFLSYASQDAEAALRLGSGLRAAGVEVWLDQEGGLVGGDAWDRKIREQIAACALFVPIISASTQARLEGYFRLEWKLAAQRTHMMSERTAFLLPVVIDATLDADADVPVEFKAVQWTRLRPSGYGGQARIGSADSLPAFCARVKNLLSGEVGARASPPASRTEITLSPAGGTPALPGKRFPVGLLGTLALVAVAVSAYVALRPVPKSAVAPVSSAALPPAAQPPTDFAAAKSDDKSIAVLPFANQSDDKDSSAFFSDGIHEDILTNLANIRELRVVSRTSVMEYRGTTKKIRQIAGELGVAYILEGSVRRAGNKVRITGQLIRAANDEHIWAKAFDRDLTDVFAIQAALATEIAGALQAAISPETKKLLERRPTENMAAYDFFLKGREAIKSLGGGIGMVRRAAFQRAEQNFRDAVELDPNFALAWAELADVHASYVYNEFDVTPSRLAQADAAIGRAVRLAPDAPGVIGLLGAYAYHGYRDYARAIAQFEKVIQLQPNNADAIYNLGVVERLQGRRLESLGHLRKAAELDPGNVSYAAVYRGALVQGRRWEEAIAAQRRVVAMAPDRLDLQADLTRIAFAATGSTKDADDWLARLSPSQLESPLIISQRKRWAIVKGDFAEWKRLDGIQTLDDGETPRWQRATEAAVVLAAHGDMAAAKARLADSPTEVRSALQLEPTNARLWAQLGAMEAVLGQKEEAVRDARKAVQLMPETLDEQVGLSLSVNLAAVYAWTGDKDAAIAEVARLLRRPIGLSSAVNCNVHYLRSDLRFYPLRGDPRFEALLNDPRNNAPLY